MSGLRAWACVLWVLTSMSLGCAKEASSGEDAPSVTLEADAIVEAEAANAGDVTMPLGMDFEKGIPPWYLTGAGKIEVERVRKGLETQSPVLTSCNKAWEPGRANANAKIMLQFTISEEGHISEMFVSENSSGDPGLAECVVEGMRPMNFDPPPAGGEITYEMPLYFAKRE